MKNTAVVISLFALSSCGFGGEEIDGNGNITTENRNVADFENVTVSAPADVMLQQAGTFSIQVKGDENLLPYLLTEVKGKTIEIKVKEGYNLNPEKALQVMISAPKYEDLSVAGSGNLYSQNTLSGSDEMNLNISGSGDMKLAVDTKDIESHIAGSGDITLSGKTEEASLAISGAGNLHCFSLNAEKTKVNINGSGNADVYAQKELVIKINGSGDVRYKGAASVNSSINGSGSAVKAD